MADIQGVLEGQRSFFGTQKTFNLSFRKAMLKKLKAAIASYEAEITKALYDDLGKSKTESYMCEIGMTLSEISYQIDHLEKMARPKRKRTPLMDFHAKSFVVQEPYGCVLIMSPWNYPFMLCIGPLAGAIAAGNCCVIKPSAYAPATSAIIKKMINSTFEAGFIDAIEGGREENAALLEQRFDYIFFTGGVNVGKLVMEKAAAHLTPVTLELGGKSPCIIDRECDIKRAAKRLAFGKYLNCGQTCVAPDYVLVHKEVKEEFVQELLRQIKAMYSEDPLSSADYGKIINHKHFERILGLIDEKKIVCGGTYDIKTCKIAPTVMDNVTKADPVMQEEIFGPVLPLITVESMGEAEAFVRTMEKPLALYIFTNNKETERRFINTVSFGGGCINDTIMHLSNPELGFGGVGNSGMGSYHGAKSFETFSHSKSILKTYNWIDMPVRYAPYKEFWYKIMRAFLK